MKIQKHSAIMNMVNSIEMNMGYVGYAVVDAKWKTERLATPFNRLYLIESGTGVLSTEQEEVILEPGKAYLLPAGLPCSYHCNGSLSQLFFHFELTQPDQFDLMHNATALGITEYPPERFAQLRRLCEGTGYTEAFEIICAVYNIVLEMNRENLFRWDEAPAYSPCVASTIKAIKENLSAQLRIDDLSQQAFVSRSYLARQFRKEVGVTIKQYVHQQLINAAQWRLSHTDASVEKISNDLGFCNQFYFSECFKKHCRVSPLQYRHGTRY